jgi:hypothetical protein
LLLFSTAAFGGPCIPGTLLDYLSLDPFTGCDLNQVQFSNFFLGELQNGATEIDPASIQVTPSGGLDTATLLFTLNVDASAGELFESSFHFSAAHSPLNGASITLGSPQAAGDGVAIGILDVCAEGSFLGVEPIGCSGSPGTAIVAASDFDTVFSDGVSFPGSSFFDVFVDLTVDGGLGGFASMDSAAVTVTTPEPSTMLVIAFALAGLSVLEARRRRF